MSKNSIIEQLKLIEGHLVLMVLIPGYKQGRIGQLTYGSDGWMLSNLYDEEGLPIRIPVDKVLKVTQVETWDVYDAMIYVEIG